MDYQTFTNQQFIPRVQAALNGLKTNLISAGIQASKITVTEVTSEGVSDLRYRIVANRGTRTLTAYVELTAAGIINGAMAIVVTLWIDGNANQITTSFNPGNPVPYDDPAALDGLLTKLSTIESIAAGELLSAARAFLQI